MAENHNGPWFVAFRDALTDERYKLLNGFADEGEAVAVARDIVTRQPNTEALILGADRRYRASITIDTEVIRPRQHFINPL